MICPNCGALMNRHAEKPLKIVPSEEPIRPVENPDDLIAAIHCCPACGKIEAEILDLRE